ncbi:MAG: dihydroorotate dehydrogenase, partial [Clostridia bacterium]|nr:dihydroorotate dehydrogenase [Clostridia bacterium]
GGVMNGRDVVEFMIAGATLVALGTGLFVNPKMIYEVKSYLNEYMTRHNISDLKDIIGTLELN